MFGAGKQEVTFWLRYRLVPLVAGLVPNGGCDVRNLSILKTRKSLMLKFYVKTSEAVRRLLTDQDGVVSFEYVIVAACIIAVVSLGFGKGGPLQTALTTAITSIGTALTNAVTAA
jgi:pilus assembly protein Flp/PilA